jgi:hypothetical protein
MRRARVGVLFSIEESSQGILPDVQAVFKRAISVLASTPI